METGNNGELMFRIGVDASDFEKAQKKILDELEETRKHAVASGEDVDEAVADMAKSYREEIAEAMEDLREEFKKVEKSTEEFEAVYKDACEEFGEDSDEAREAFERFSDSQTSRDAISERINQLNELDETIERHTQGLDTSVQTSGQMINDALQNIGQSFGMGEKASAAFASKLKSGFGSIKAGLAGLRTGMKATEIAGKMMWGALTLGISLILPIIIELADKLKSVLSGGFDKVKEKSAAFKEAMVANSYVSEQFDRIMGKIGDFFANGFSSAIEKATAGLKKMAEGLTDLVGFINEDWGNSLRDSLNGIYDDIEERQKEMWAEMTAGLRNAESDYGDQQTQIKIDRNNARSRDKSLTFEERIAGLDENIELERKRMEDNVKLAKSQLARVKREAKQIAQDKGKETVEALLADENAVHTLTQEQLDQLKAYQEANKKIADIEQRGMKNIERATQQRNNLRERQIAEDEAYGKAMAKLAEDSQKEIEDARIAAMKNETERSIKESQTAFKRRKEQLKEELAETMDAMKQNDINHGGNTSVKSDAEYEKLAKAQMNYDAQVLAAEREMNKGIADARKAREEMEKQYAEERKNTIEEAEREITNAQIEAMDEGWEKEQMKREQKEKDAIAAIEKQVEERAKALAEQDEKTTGKTQSEDFYKQKAEDELKAAERIKQAKAQTLKDEEDYYQKMLGEYRSYEEKRKQIEEEYEAKKKEVDGAVMSGKMSADDASGMYAKIEAQMQEAQAKLDEEEAQKSEDYLVWLETIADLGLEQMRAKLTEAQAELTKAIDLKQATAEQRAAVETLKKKVQELERAERVEQALHPNAAKIKQYEALKVKVNTVGKALNTAIDSLEGFSDGWSDTAKKALKTAKEIGNAVESIINSIIDLAKGSLEATETTAKAAAEGIKEAERASVILAIIQAAMQVVMAMFNLFKKESSITEQVVQQHDNEIAAMDVVIEKNKEMIEARKKYTTELKDLYEAEAKASEAKIQKEITWAKTLGKERKSGEHSANHYLQNNGKGIRVKTFDKDIKGKVNEDAYKKLEAAAKGGTEAIAKVMAEFDRDTFRALQTTNWWANFQSFNSKLTDAFTSINETANAEREFQETQAENSRGFSRTDVMDMLMDSANDLSNALDNVADSWENMLKAFLNRKAWKKAEEQMDDLEEMIDEAFADGEIDAQENKGIQDKLNEIMGGVTDDVKKLYTLAGIDWEDASQDKAQAKGIATASQESVDENNGRLAQIQAHTFMMASDVSLLTANSSEILDNVVVIRNCSEMIKEDVNRMFTQGVRMLN